MYVGVHGILKIFTYGFLTAKRHHNFRFFILSESTFRCSGVKFRFCPDFPERNTHKGQSLRWQILTSCVFQSLHSIHFARIADSGVRFFVTIPSFVGYVCLIAITLTFFAIFISRHQAIFLGPLHPCMFDSCTVA
jgi:hypothetical protein